MNPSKNLWVTKFFKLSNPSFFLSKTDQDFYESIRKTGFVYGFCTSTINPIFNNYGLTQEENSKIVLLEALYGTYLIQTKNTDINSFKNEIQRFYSALATVSTNSFFGFISNRIKVNKNDIEIILNSRIDRNVSYLDKTLSSHLTNFLLFTDVLCFKRWLLNNEDILTYYKYLEKTIYQLVTYSYGQKKLISKYDLKLLDILKESFRYTTNSESINNFREMDFSNIITSYGKNYLFDLVLMVVWSDKRIDEKELHYITKIASEFDISENTKNNAINEIGIFISNNLKDIPYFQFHHPLKKIYKNTNESISLIIKRNKTSITKELLNNKKLAQLIYKSTYANLTIKEKLLVKNQLIELGKTIPSLTLFALPGGSLLLPIFIKLIPELLPKSFNENKS